MFTVEDSADGEGISGKIGNYLPSTLTPPVTRLSRVSYSKSTDALYADTPGPELLEASISGTSGWVTFYGN